MTARTLQATYSRDCRGSTPKSRRPLRAADPHGMRRPGSYTVTNTSTGAALWQSGSYAYNNSGSPVWHAVLGSRERYGSVVLREGFASGHRWSCLSMRQLGQSQP